MSQKKLIALAITTVLSQAIAQNTTMPPNILIIVADDMGYSDITPFGGEIPTPNLQEIADQGIRMSQFYTAPMSAPARSMLMTGNSNQQAGMGGMWWYDNTMGADGYELRLTNRVVTMSERFKDAGYATMMSGKWHLGFITGSKPTDRGFDRAFAFMGGGSSHFNDVMPLGTGEAFHTYYTLNGDVVDKNTLPADFYSSNAFAKQLNQWIIDTPKDQPIFAYLPFTAPHDPLQAPDEWIAKFKGQYEQGYAPIYEARIKRLKEMRFITENTPLPKLSLKKEWNDLSQEGQKYAAKSMQVYAAMVAHMDNQIGTVLKTLKKTGRYDNTIIVFMGDNGANPKLTHLYDSKPEYWLQFDDSYENMGKKGSFITYGPQWANVSNAPYANFHKTTSAQGGINTNLIISGIGIQDKGQIKNNAIAIYDIAPTLYDMTGIYETTLPNGKGELKYNAHTVLPMIGLSYATYFKNSQRNYVSKGLGIELHNQAAFIENEWKIRRLVKTSPSAGMADWELFNLKNDPTETKNIAQDHPDILKRLIQHYEQYAKHALVIEAKGGLRAYIGLDPVTNQPLKYVGQKQ